MPASRREFLHAAGATALALAAPGDARALEGAPLPADVVTPYFGRKPVATFVFVATALGCVGAYTTESTPLLVVSAILAWFMFRGRVTGVYVAIITLATVGYGDAFPVTPLGKLLAGLTAITGIGLIAMPTGILAAAFSDAIQRQREEKEARREKREKQQEGEN